VGTETVKLRWKIVPIARLLATALRSASMGVRLIGIVVLARFMGPQDYGEFAFVVVFGAFIGFITGAEIYTRTIFKITNRPVARWGPFVSRQYVVVARIVLLVWLGALGISLAIDSMLPMWIMAIATADIVNLENNRMLVIAKSHVFASGMIFFRQVTWLLLSFAFLSNSVFSNPAQAALSAWTLAGLMTATLSLLWLYRLGLRLRQVRMPFSLMTKIVASSSMMLLSGLAVRGLISLDKIVLGLSDTYNLMGAYAFFATLAFAIVPIVDDAVFIYLMPRLVSASNIKAWADVLSQLRKATYLVGGLVAFYAVLLFTFADVMLSWIGQPYYSANFQVLYLMMAAGAVYVLAMIGHYGVYALRQGKWLFLNNAFALALCHTAYIVLWLHDLPLAMPLALLIAILGLLMANCRAFWRAFVRARSTA
jgi:O-antigen/teichoic acid export membrane protein